MKYLSINNIYYFYLIDNDLTLYIDRGLHVYYKHRDFRILYFTYDSKLTFLSYPTQLRQIFQMAMPLVESVIKPLVDDPHADPTTLYAKFSSMRDILIVAVNELMESYGANVKISWNILLTHFDFQHSNNLYVKNKDFRMWAQELLTKRLELENLPYELVSYKEAMESVLCDGGVVYDIAQSIRRPRTEEPIYFFQDCATSLANVHRCFETFGGLVRNKEIAKDYRFIKIPRHLVNHLPSPKRLLMTSYAKIIK